MNKWLYTILFLLLMFSPRLISAENANPPISDNLIDKIRETLSESEYDDEVVHHINSIISKYSTSSDIKELTVVTEMCSSLGDVLFKKELYTEAFRFINQGIIISEENNIDLFLPVLYKNKGNVYDVYGDTEMAVSCYEKSLSMARKQNNSEVEFRTLCNLSMVCARTCQLEKAQFYHDEMIKLGQHSPKISYFRYFTEALMAKCINNSSASVSGFKNALDYALSHNLAPYYAATAYSQLANSYMDAGITDSAEFYLEKNMAFCDENNLIYEQQFNFKDLILLYNSLGKKEQAQEISMRYYFLQDTLLKVESFMRAKESEIILDMEKITKLSQTAELKAEKIKNQRIILFIVSLFLIVVIFVILAIEKQRRKLNRVNRYLYSRNIELVEKNTKYDALLESYITLKEKSEKGKTYENREDSTEIANETTKKENVSINIKEEHIENIKNSIFSIMANPKIYCEKDFSIERLAELVGYNKKYVSQVINSTQQKNFRAFVNEYRINEASKRLKDDKYANLTIRAIGEDLGFKSYANFIETFQKITGMTPSDFRKIAKTSCT